MATRILSCLIALTFVLSSTGPALAVQPAQQMPINPAAAVPTQAAVSRAPSVNIATAPNAEIAVVLAQATQIAAGDHHTCALTSTGGVQCWGLNAYRQLDDGTWSNYSTTPVDVPGLTTGVTAIAAGEDSACAITAGGGVTCWTYPYSSTPSDVTGLTAGVTAIALGTYHTCALTTEGGVQCWGDNVFGQLGDGTTTDSITPVDVSGLTAGVIAITAGEYHTCVITAGGGVRCWGWNEDGELGDGTTTGHTTPVDVSGLTAGVTAIDAGRQHTCVVAAGGGVKCWGSNYSSQLGDGTTTARTIPVAVSGLAATVTTVAAGDSHTCALTSGGGVKCWGSGLLGDGTTSSRATPVDVSGLTAGVTAITAGASHTCAVAERGALKCWGNNDYGQLGDGTTTSTNTITPGAVSGLTAGVRAIVTHSSHTCAITTAGGVKCWGYNYYGELGDGTTTNRATPVEVTGLTTGVSTIAAGTYHTCAVYGRVNCWGHNGSGQLGDGTTTNRTTPVGIIGWAEVVTAIAAGGSHTCALSRAGGVQCWGHNFFGQIGDGTYIGHLNPVDVSGLAAGVTAIAAGEYHTCAITTGGGVKCWGLGFNGQLGDGNRFDRTTPVDVSGLGSGVTAIAAGTDHTCALTAAGGVRCWGSNEFGQLGDGTTSAKYTPIDVSGLAANATAITTGYYHTCAITAGGGVKCWGANGSGRLGDGTTIGRTAPVDVNGLAAGVTAVAAGDSHTCALTTAGGVKCWGSNTYGELGRNPGWTPVDVVGFEGIVLSTLSGRVTSSGGQPLVGVTISAGAAGSASSDSNGAYTISELPAGTYTLTPSLSDYAFTPPSRTITVPPGAPGQDFVGMVILKNVFLPLLLRQ